MTKIVFVILHYETTEDTKKCINSLLQYLSDSVETVIVDNGSSKGKLTDIAALYESNEHVYFIYSEKNLGFANGNNIGFIYAKDELCADIIILANNDLLFVQDDFIQVLRKKVSEIQFDVAGPKIISLVDGLNQNPVPKLYSSLKDVNKRIFKFRVLKLLSFFNLDLVLKNKMSSGIPRVNEYNHESDFQLHGACIILANKFVKKHDGLCSMTFMYGEESILKFQTETEDMRMTYIDDLIVYHKEGSSTQAIWGKGKKSRQFYYKWNIDSCKVLLSLMKGKKNGG